MRMRISRRCQSLGGVGEVMVIMKNCDLADEVQVRRRLARASSFAGTSRPCVVSACGELRGRGMADEDVEQSPDDFRPSIARGRKERASRDDLAPKLNRPGQRSQADPATAESPTPGSNLQSIGEDACQSYDDEEVAIASTLSGGTESVRHEDTPGMRKLNSTASNQDDPPSIARGRRERASREMSNPRMSRPPPKS